MFAARSHILHDRSCCGVGGRTKEMRGAKTKSIRCLIVAMVIISLTRLVVLRMLICMYPRVVGGFKMGLTIVDSLDTLWIMGLKEEFEKGRQWVRDNLVFGTPDQVTGLVLLQLSNVSLMSYALFALSDRCVTGGHQHVRNHHSYSRGSALCARAQRRLDVLGASAAIGRPAVDCFQVTNWTAVWYGWPSCTHIIDEVVTPLHRNSTCHIVSPSGTLGLHTKTAHNPSWCGHASSVSEVLLIFSSIFCAKCVQFVSTNLLGWFSPAGVAIPFCAHRQSGVRAKRK